MSLFLTVSVRTAPVLNMPSAGRILCLNDDVSAPWQTKSAHRLIAFTAQRSGPAVCARWDDLDLDQAVWSIPCEQLKHDRSRCRRHAPRAVALPRQTVEMLGTLKRESEFLFFSPHDATRHITLEGLETHLRRRLKLAGTHTLHSWRRVFVNWAYEQITGEGRLRFNPEDIELVLGMSSGWSPSRLFDRRGTVRRTRELIQAWADALEMAQAQAGEGAQVE